MNRHNTVHSKKEGASFWQLRGAGTGPRQMSEPGFAAVLKLGSHSSLQNTHLVSNEQPARVDGDIISTCPCDRPPAWLKMLFRQSD